MLNENFFEQVGEGIFLIDIYEPTREFFKERKMKEKVAIVKCKSYKQEEVDKAVRKILKLLNFPLNKYKKILIKPNVLGNYKKNEEAIITHTSIVKALLKIFKKARVGESSFTDTENVLRKSDYWKFKPVVFEEQKFVKIKNAGKILKNFYLPEIVKKSDLIINVPKMKTHSLTKMTGAIKNLYGCIPGGMKQVFHKKAYGEEKFSSLLVDIYQNINPGLNIMDAVICMEGEGPSAGEKKKAGLILASKNAVALDVVASRVMGFKAEEIFTVKEAVERGFGSYNIKIVGDFCKIPNLKFKKPVLHQKSLIKGFLVRFVKENPINVDEKKCTKCRLCERKCPMKAIELSPYPNIDEKKCIRCFCCIEICPEHALHLKETSLMKFIRKIREVRDRK